MATNDDHPGQASRYLDYLPAIYQQDAQIGQPNFLGRFLLAFEQMLTGLGDVDVPGLEEILEGLVDPVSGAIQLAGIQRYLDPGPNLPDRRPGACASRVPGVAGRLGGPGPTYRFR